MMRGYGLHGGYGVMGGGWLGPVIMIVLWVVLAVVIALLVAWVVRMIRHQGAPRSPQANVPGHDEAVAIARRRLASGEITKDQFDEIMSTLGG